MQTFTTRQSSKETISTISSKGQVTLPVEVRRHLRVKSKDKVAFVIEPDGEVRVTQVKYPTIRSLQGAAGSLKQPIEWKKLREQARQERIDKKYGKKNAF